MRLLLQVRSAAYQALSCYKPADLEAAELLRPLQDYAALLLGETDSSARLQCQHLLQGILKYEYSIRRRYILSLQLSSHCLRYLRARVYIWRPLLRCIVPFSISLTFFPLIKGANLLVDILHLFCLHSANQIILDLLEISFHMPFVCFVFRCLQREL